MEIKKNKIEKFKLPLKSDILKYFEELKEIDLRIEKEQQEVENKYSTQKLNAQFKLAKEKIKFHLNLERELRKKKYLEAFNLLKVVKRFQSNLNYALYFACVKLERIVIDGFTFRPYISWDSKVGADFFHYKCQLPLKKLIALFDKDLKIYQENNKWFLNKLDLSVIYEHPAVNKALFLKLLKIKKKIQDVIEELDLYNVCGYNSIMINLPESNFEITENAIICRVGSYYNVESFKFLFSKDNNEVSRLDPKFRFELVYKEIDNFLLLNYDEAIKKYPVFDFIDSLKYDLCKEDKITNLLSALQSNILINTLDKIRRLIDVINVEAEKLSCYEKRSLSLIKLLKK